MPLANVIVVRNGAQTSIAFLDMFLPPDTCGIACLRGNPLSHRPVIEVWVRRCGV
jgi:hypothetical protein